MEFLLYSSNLIPMGSDFMLNQRCLLNLPACYRLFWSDPFWAMVFMVKSLEAWPSYTTRYCIYDFDDFDDILWIFYTTYTPDPKYLFIWYFLCIHCKPIPVMKTGFPLYSISHREKPVFITGIPAMRTGLPVMKTVRKSSQGKPCFHYRDGFAV